LVSSRFVLQGLKKTWRRKTKRERESELLIETWEKWESYWLREKEECDRVRREIECQKSKAKKSKNNNKILSTSIKLPISHGCSY
jgi:hypothetical protein